MRRKSALFALAALVLLLSQKVIAQEIWHIEKQFTSATVVYLNGHEGDTSMISGVNFTADIFYNGSKIGTTSGQFESSNPPLDPAARYIYGNLVFVNTIPGNGNYQVNAPTILQLTSDPNSGKGTFAYAGSISNATGKIENMVGLVDGIGEFDLLNETAAIEETLSVRISF